VDETSAAGDDGGGVRDVASPPCSGFVEQRQRERRGVIDPVAGKRNTENAGRVPAFPFSAAGAMMSICP
jgi:hypothetical protein